MECLFARFFTIKSIFVRELVRKLRNVHKVTVVFVSLTVILFHKCELLHFFQELMKHDQLCDLLEKGKNLLLLVDSVYLDTIPPAKHPKSCSSTHCNAIIL